MRGKVKKIIVALNRSKEGAQQVEVELREILDAHKVKALWIAVDHSAKSLLHPIPVKDEDMVIVGGGDGTLAALPSGQGPRELWRLAGRDHAE